MRTKHEETSYHRKEEAKMIKKITAKLVVTKEGTKL
jgi:hypothetical protein